MYTHKFACAPLKQREYQKAASCYTKEQLKILVNAYNKHYSNDKIRAPKTGISKKELWNIL